MAKNNNQNHKKTSKVKTAKYNNHNKINKHDSLSTKNKECESKLKCFFWPSLMKVALFFLYFAILNLFIVEFVDYTIKTQAGIMYNIIVSIIIVVVYFLIPYTLSCITIQAYNKMVGKE